MQATKVANTSCTLEWFRLPGRTARCLILVMAMSNRPVKITAGKFLDLSLNSFGMVSIPHRGSDKKKKKKK